VSVRPIDGERERRSFVLTLRQDSCAVLRQHFLAPANEREVIRVWLVEELIKGAAVPTTARIRFVGNIPEAKDNQGTLITYLDSQNALGAAQLLRGLVSRLLCGHRDVSKLTVSHLIRADMMQALNALDDWLETPVVDRIAGIA
jgi:hypothetical protein